MPAALEVAGHEAHVVFRVAEHDRALGILVLEDPQQVRLLLLRGGDHVVVLDLLRRARVVVERDELGIAQEEARQRLHLLGDRRREQARLAVGGQVLVDLAHVGPEARARASRRPRRARACAPCRAAAAGAEVVEDAARRAHDHLVAGVDALELLRVADAAVDRQAADALRCAERLDLGGDLLGELARRREHERLTPERVGVDAGDDRDAERAGLAAAGLRLHDQVGARRISGTTRVCTGIGFVQPSAATPRRTGSGSVLEREVFGHAGAHYSRRAAIGRGSPC